MAQTRQPFYWSALIGLSVLILIGNNLVNFIAATLFTVAALRLWGEAGLVRRASGADHRNLDFRRDYAQKPSAALHPENHRFPCQQTAILVTKNRLSDRLARQYHHQWFIKVDRRQPHRC